MFWFMFIVDTDPTINFDVSDMIPGQSDDAIMWMNNQ